MNRFSPHDDIFTAAWWWINGSISEPNQYADFSCDVVLKETPESARLSLTCGSSLSLWVNGTWVLHGPPREVAPWLYFENVDLRPHLFAGINRLRIRVHHIGVSHQSHEACFAGLSLAGAICETGMPPLDLADKSLWRTRHSLGSMPHRRRLNGCTGFAEHVSLVEDFSSWLHEPAQGEEPETVARNPLPGRENLIASDIRLVEGKTTQAVFLHEREGWQHWDFGGEVFGFVGADLEADQPVECPLIHGESLTRIGLPDYRFGGGDFREILELPASRRQWESFEKRAMRYIALPSGIRVHRLTVREYHRDLVEIWKETPEAKLLSERDFALVSAAARTVILCADDLLNDCPRRERAQYNDPALYMNAFPKLFGTWEPYERWLRQYLRGADSKGVLRACYPGPEKGKFVIPDFSISFALNVRRYFEASGNRQIVADCFPSVLAGMQAYESYSDESGLLKNVPGWVFLCNSFEVAKEPRSAGLNALWASGWEHLSFLANELGDASADDFAKKSASLREAWRNCFFHAGKILDADSSPEHEKKLFWNYHYEAERGYFEDAQPNEDAFVMRFSWTDNATRFWIASPGNIRLACDGQWIFEAIPQNPWTRSPVFHPWTIELPAGIQGKELLLEVAYNPADWEVYVASDVGEPTDVRVASAVVPCGRDLQTLLQLPYREVSFRPWVASAFHQITAGYAIECGMLEPAEARDVLASCLREIYHVPWLKRTTPLICSPTDDVSLIKNRAVLCNTPQSLAFFCRALARYGMRDEATALCRQLFGRMLGRRSTTLWEEFAPRSSLCHAWGAMCVDFLLE